MKTVLNLRDLSGKPARKQLAQKTRKKSFARSKVKDDPFGKIDGTLQIPKLTSDSQNQTYFIAGIYTTAVVIQHD